MVIKITNPKTKERYRAIDWNIYQMKIDEIKGLKLERTDRITNKQYTIIYTKENDKYYVEMSSANYDHLSNSYNEDYHKKIEVDYNTIWYDFVIQRSFTNKNYCITKF